MDSVIEDVAINQSQPRDLIEQSLDSAFFPPVVQTLADSKRLFEFAESRWNSSLNVEGLEQTLSDIARSKITPTQERFKELKGLRKNGLILLSAWNLFDEQHVGPKAYWKLINRLGKLNDDFFSPAAPEKALETSKALQEYLGEKETFIFKPASPSSVQSFIHSVAQNIEKRLEDHQLNGEELHEIRKKGTRFLMNAYQIAHLADPSSTSFKQAFDKLHDTDLQLGVIKDTMEAKKSDLPLVKQTTEITPALRASLLAITKSF